MIAGNRIGVETVGIQDFERRLETLFVGNMMPIGIAVDLREYVFVGSSM